MISLDVQPGIYQSFESVPDDWVLTSIVCDDTNSSGDSDSAFFDVEAGEVVTCVFTNTKNGTIVIEKQTLPEGDPTEFSFSGDVSGLLSDDETITLEVEPGIYQSTEDVPDDWVLTSIVCDDSNSGDGDDEGTVVFDVQPGEAVTCVFTNTKNGTIIIEKQTIPDGDPTEFSFSGAVSGLLSDDETISLDVEPGIYQATEIVPSGWELTSIVCDDDDSGGDVDTAFLDVDAGEVVTCVFTNTKTNTRPMITDMADVEIDENQTTGPIPFTVDDQESSVLVVTAISQNTSLVPTDNIVLEGTGDDRTITITPAENRSGVTTIEVTVRDDDGAEASGLYRVDRESD